MATDKELVKASKNNYFFFMKRCRSRSFHEIEELNKDAAMKHLDKENENLFGYGVKGQRFEFSPKDPSIIQKYEDTSIIFEDVLCPAVIKLSTWADTKKNVVAKRIMKSKLLSDAVKTSARREWAIHSTLKHKNVIEMYEYTENDDELALYLEYANKPFFLNDLIVESHTPIEDQAELRHLAAQMLEGLRYIHAQGVVHGDLKLPNILWNEEDDVIAVKICDFGFSHIVDPAKGNKVLIKDVSGTLGHIAPEVKSNSLIGTEVDMWCFGLLLYEMAVAYKPTQVKNFSYSDGEIPFRKFDWRRKSPELQDLIVKCMNFDPALRLTAEEALNHPWFTQDN